MEATAGGKRRRRGRGRIPVRGGSQKTIHQTEEEANYRKEQEGNQRNMHTSRGRRRILISSRRCIKWRKLQTMNSTGRENKTMEERVEDEKRGKHKKTETWKQVV